MTMGEAVLFSKLVLEVIWVLIFIEKNLI